MQTAPQVEDRKATIASGGGTSSAIDIAGFRSGGLSLPAAFTGTALTFQVSADGTTYQTVYKSDNNTDGLTVGQGRSYKIPDSVFGFRFMKIVSNGTEAADRTILLNLKGN